MNAFNPILGCGREQAACGKIFRRGSELRGAAGRATAAKKEDDGRPTITGLPLRREIEIDFQIALRCCLVQSHGFVADRADIGPDRL